MAKKKHKKLKITAYKDPKFKQEIQSISLQINPTEYTWSHQGMLDTTQKKIKKGGECGDDDPLEAAKPRELSFKFTLDATGVTGEVIDINKTLKDLRKIACDYNGETHGSNYLKVLWGQLSFKCQLSSLSVSYKLFNREGNPLRVECDAKFQQFLDVETLKAMQNSSSPDLTHIHTIQAGDTLPNICYEIYGNPKYYLKIAEINGLTHFRKLKAGQRLTLPPLDK